MEKDKEYGEIVKAANSIDALKNVVGMIGTVETSGGAKMTAKEVNDWIDMATQFPKSAALDSITRNYGLRDKVSELIDPTRKLGMEKRVDAALEAEETKAEGVAALDRLDKAAVKRERANAMEQRVDADLATDDLLDEFTKRGKIMDSLHGAGWTLDKGTAAGGRGELNAEEFEQAEKAAAEMPNLDQQLARAEQALKDSGIADVDEAMNTRAVGGFAKKAKEFFGGLFNKKTRDLNSLMDTYASIRDQRNDALEKIMKRRPMTEEQKALKQKQAEGRR